MKVSYADKLLFYLSVHEKKAIAFLIAQHITRYPLNLSLAPYFLSLRQLIAHYIARENYFHRKQ